MINDYVLQWVSHNIPRFQPFSTFQLQRASDCHESHDITDLVENRPEEMLNISKHLHPMLNIPWMFLYFVCFTLILKTSEHQCCKVTVDANKLTHLQMELQMAEEFTCEPALFKARLRGMLNVV